MEVEIAKPEVTQILEEVNENLNEVKFDVEEVASVPEKTQDRFKSGSLSKFFRSKSMKGSNNEDFAVPKAQKSNTLMRLFSKKEKPQDEVVGKIKSEFRISMKELNVKDANAPMKSSTFMRLFSKEKPKAQTDNEVGAESIVQIEELSSSSVSNVTTNSVPKTSTLVRLFSKKEKPKDEKQPEIEAMSTTRRSFIMRGLANCHVVPWIGRPSQMNVTQPLELVSIEKDDDDDDETPQEVAEHSENL